MNLKIAVFSTATALLAVGFIPADQLTYGIRCAVSAGSIGLGWLLFRRKP